MSTRIRRAFPVAALAALVLAAAALAPIATGDDGTDTTGPKVTISPTVVHVKNGKIRLKATCPGDEALCSGVILGHLPIARKRGSILDPGSLGGPILTIKPGQTVQIAFPVSAPAKAFLATHPKTTLTVQAKMVDDAGNEGTTQSKVTLFAR